MMPSNHLILKAWVSESFNQFGRLCVPGGSVVKNLPANAGDVGSLSGFGRSLAEGNRQRTAVFLPGKFDGQKNLVGHGITELDTTQRLNNPF